MNAGYRLLLALLPPLRRWRYRRCLKRTVKLERELMPWYYAEEKLTNEPGRVLTLSRVLKDTYLPPVQHVTLLQEITFESTMKDLFVESFIPVIERKSSCPGKLHVVVSHDPEPVAVRERGFVISVYCETCFRRWSKFFIIDPAIRHDKNILVYRMETFAREIAHEDVLQLVS